MEYSPNASQTTKYIKSWTKFIPTDAEPINSDQSFTCSSKGRDITGISYPRLHENANCGIIVSIPREVHKAIAQTPIGYHKLVAISSLRYRYNSRIQVYFGGYRLLLQMGRSYLVRDFTIIIVIGII